jgi:hypothetical protein
MSAEAWDFLKVFVTLVVAPAVMWWLNKQQTAKIAATQAETAKEVKADLQTAKTELKHDAAVREVKLDAVHSLVNGDRLAKQRRIEELEGKLRDHGLDA